MVAMNLQNKKKRVELDDGGGLQRVSTNERWWM